MSEPPPLPQGQKKADSEHLNLLSIFHFVLSGLTVIGLGFLFLHYMVMNTVFSDPEMWKDSLNDGPDPAEFIGAFKWFYGFAGFMLVVGGILNLISGLSIRKRKQRVFSLVVAGLNCLQFPFGTALGVFTFIVLSRSSVRESYDQAVEVV